jgi:hypothetical protein
MTYPYLGGWVGECFEGIGLWMGWTYAKIFGGPCPHVVASQSCASHNFQASFPKKNFYPKEKVIKLQIIFISAWPAFPSIDVIIITSSNS